MQSFFLTWLITAIALVITANVVTGITLPTGFVALALAALVVGLVNAVVRPILGLLTLPLNILTLGLFSFILNAFCLMLASYFGPAGFEVAGFIPALIGSIVLSIATSILGFFFGR